MKTLPRGQTAKMWDQYWDDMKKEWFKIEVLQDYSGEDDGPSLAAWKNGDKEESKRLFIDQVVRRAKAWQLSCQTKVKNGVQLIRIHIVEEPYSEYLEWELMVYKIHNIPICGEKVFLVPKSQLKDLDIPKGDVMIFDGKRLANNTYNESGLMTQVDYYDADLGDDISRFLSLKAELIKKAQPVML